MSSKRKERIKSFVLGLLVILLLFQIRIAWTYEWNGEDDPFAAITQFFNKAAGNMKEIESSITYPIELAVCSENGFYAKRSGDMQSDFNTILPILQNAMQKAGAFSQVNDFGDDLQQPLVYVKYSGEIPLPFFCRWSGIKEERQDLMFSGLMVVQTKKNGYRIYLRDSQNQQLYMAKTSIDDQLFLKCTDSFSACGGGFAADFGYIHFLPETIVIDGTEDFSILKASIPEFDENDSQNSKQKLLEAFSYNPYTVKNYQDNDGKTTVFVENQSTLCLGQDGHVVFEANSLNGGIDVIGDQEDMQIACGEFAYSIVNKILESIGGGEAYMSAMKSEDSNITSYEFQSIVSGIPVDDMVHGYLAKLYFRNQKLIQADIYLRQYKETGETLSLMPAKQLAQMVTGTKEITVRYTDTGGTRILPQWEQAN